MPGSDPTVWTEQRDAWVQNAPDWMLLNVIAAVASGTTDETMGDAIERRETVLWLASRGREGREWGSAAEAARQFGRWESDD